MSLPSRAALAVLVLLSACQRDDAPEARQRIALDQVGQRAQQPAASPDTNSAFWSVAADGQAIDFGNSGSKPFLTLACRLRDDPPSLVVIRHVVGHPGEQALFPVLGNGRISRFKLDAALADGEWRWQGQLPASDPQVDVFAGSNQLEATLPGGGTLLIRGSRVPAEFVAWCRNRGAGPTPTTAAPPSSPGPRLKGLSSSLPEQ